VSYTNQTTTTLADFISKLNTFLAGTPGWTTTHTPASGEFAARKTGAGFDIGFATKWDTGTPSNLGIYQWYNAAYNTGANPWAQTNDSGNGAASATNATLATARHAPITNTPVQFWCFEDDNYFHCVVQTTTTNFVHFGAGYLDKFNDWTGGEYVYGFRKDQNNTGLAALSGPSATILLDGLTADVSGFGYNDAELFCATMHAEGLAGQGGSEKWCVVMGNQASANLGNDRQGSPQARRHMLGGYRGGVLMKNLNVAFRGSLGRGLCPMAPIIPFYWRRSPDEVYGPMGQMKDVRQINIASFVAGDEITIGSDTWVVFPAAAKSSADAMSGGAGFTGYQGIAYKKVTT
jgi:hypothetical protein